MLEQVLDSKTEGAIIFKHIAPDSNGRGQCYVRGGVHKFTSVGKPFIKLTLQDINGTVMPGYIFDVADFKKAGLELTAVTNKVVLIDYTENYHVKYGMSVIVDKISIVNDMSGSLLRQYVKTAEDAMKKYDNLMAELTKLLNIKISLPYTICTASNLDYFDGAVGGLCLHYSMMLDIIKSKASLFNSDDERRKLFGTFLMFIYAHSNYNSASSSGSVGVQLASQLTLSVSKYVEQIGLGSGAIETVHYFFGYEPKDIFVRLVVQASEDVMRSAKEVAIYNSLPDSREGNAGYGTILRYAD